jgi:hypothetical protein
LTIFLNDLCPLPECSQATLATSRLILRCCDHVFALVSEDLERFVADRSQLRKDWSATNATALVVLDLWRWNTHPIAAQDALDHVAALHAKRLEIGSPCCIAEVWDRFQFCNAGTECLIVCSARSLTTRGKKTLERSQHLITRLVRETEMGESLRDFGWQVSAVTPG